MLSFTKLFPLYLLAAAVAGGCSSNPTYDGTFYNGTNRTLALTFADASAAPGGPPKDATLSLAPGDGHHWSSTAPCVEVTARDPAGGLLYSRQIDYKEYLLAPARTGAPAATRRFMLADREVYEIPREYQDSWRDHETDIRNHSTYLPTCLPHEPGAPAGK